MPRSPVSAFLPLALAFGVAHAALAGPTAEKAERIAEDKVAVTWTAKAPVDVYVADRPDAAVAVARQVSDDNRKGRLELAVEPTARPYFLLVDTRDGAVVRVAERVLPLEHGSNFRDIGGYPAADGKHVRWGQIYRSGATPLLTDADVAKVAGLGLADLVDLRSSEERSLAPTRVEGVRYAAVGYSMTKITGAGGAEPGTSRSEAIYRAFPTLLAPQLKILFETLLDDREGAVAFNCSAGQDRTGFATALILSALGVPREVIFADYHLSTTYRRPEYEMPRLNPAALDDNPVAAYFARFQQEPGPRKPRPLFDDQQRPLLQFALAEVDSRWGSVEAYLDKELGVSAADLAALKARYLE